MLIKAEAPLSAINFYMLPGQTNSAAPADEEIILSVSTPGFPGLFFNFYYGSFIYTNY
jgi:hypothetical protein